MKIGVVREVMADEERVALTSAGARTLTDDGHKVLIERGAGEGAGIPDDAYRAAGGAIAENADEVWLGCDLLVKVKQPVDPEFQFLRPDLTVFAYLHLAPNRPLTEALLEQGTTAIAFETVTDAQGRLPLLAPMSEIAGRVAAQEAAHHLLRPHGGPGILAGGAAGVAPARFLVLGGGVVGLHAARVGRGLGAEVAILEASNERVRTLAERLSGSIRVLANDPETLELELSAADVVIGAVLIPGASAPRLISRKMLGGVKSGAVLVDVAIDQGGCFETSRPTTHSDPIFWVDDVIHYCVANMPGATPVTSTRALANATLPFVRKLARMPAHKRAQPDEPGLAAGVNVAGGELRHPAVAQALPDLPAFTGAAGGANRARGGAFDDVRVVPSAGSA